MEYQPYSKCEEECRDNEECDECVYEYVNSALFAPICYIKADLPLDSVNDSNYVTGLHLPRNQCDCIYNDCYPGNDYEFIYIDDAREFERPLNLESKLYSHAWVILH